MRCTIAWTRRSSNHIPLLLSFCNSAHVNSQGSLPAEVRGLGMHRITSGFKYGCSAPVCLLLRIRIRPTREWPDSFSNTRSLIGISGSSPFFAFSREWDTLCNPLSFPLGKGRCS